MKIPFVGGSHQARSLNADAQRSVNCYVEMDNASPRAPVALYGTPGAVLKFTLPTSPVRGGVVAGAYLWCVAGNTVYRVDTAYNITTIGTINTSVGELGLSSNGTQILIVDGVAGWLVNVAASSMAVIADADFPNGVKRAAFQDGYFIVTGLAGSPSFWINQTAYDGATWDGLDFASAEGSPDNTLGVISDHRELWLFGANSAEIWINTGAVDFTFARSGNTFIEHGCRAAGTIAKLDNTVFWLGADERGSGIVWRAEGYTPNRISTHAMEKAVQGYSSISDAFAFTYQQEGHGFYALTFPTAGKTWVYDVASNEWHERAWRNPSTNVLTRWRANCYAFFNDLHLVGDFESGKVYSLDLDTYTDNGDPILRLRTTQTMNEDGLKLFFESLQVDMETGVGLSTGQGSAPLLMLRYSNDGGHSWSNIRTVSIGAVGEYGARAIFRRLGAGRNRVWEVSMTDPCKFAVFGAFAKVSKGTS